MVMTKHSPKQHPYRVGLAAIGRMYVRMIGYARSNVVTDGEFRDMMMGVMCYIEDPGWKPGPEDAVNPEVMGSLCAGIDKSARLSAAARGRAARRKERQEGGGGAAAAREAKERAYPPMRVAEPEARRPCHVGRRCAPSVGAAAVREVDSSPPWRHGPAPGRSPDG